MVLWHGSNMAVESPKVVQTKYAKDFGWGFYTTRNFEQAKKWAYRKAALEGGSPIISKYEFLPSNDLDKLEFYDTDSRWLHFIAQCRQGGTHAHDVVAGPMADDQVWNLVEDFMSGDISEEEFLVAAKFKHPTNQISFHTEKAFCALEYLGYEEV